MARDPAHPAGSIRQAFEHARRLVQDGKRQMAVEQLTAILEVAPNEVNALVLLGSLKSVEKQLPDALALLHRATALAPGFHDAVLELARVQRLDGQVDEAIATLQGLTSRAPTLSRAWQLLGDSLYEAGQMQPGRAAFRRAAETDPHRGQIQEAIAALAGNRRHDGEQILRDILKTDPNHVHALVGLASIAIEAGIVTDAEHLLEHARRLSPYSDVVWRNVARLHSQRADYPKAEAAALRAVELDPDTADTWSMLGNVQAWGLKPEDAQTSFERSLALSDAQPRVWMSLGHVRKTIGDRAGCEAAYKTAIAQDANLGEAYWSLADLKTYTFSEGEIAAMEGLLAAPALAPLDRASLHFALGKAYEDGGVFQPAFNAYAAGNAIKAKLDPFDSEQFESTCADIKQVFTSDFLASRGAEPSGPTPIFIVGLPRSGSTLLEQILASHSAVEGTMELPHMLNYVREMQGRAGYPAACAGMSASDFEALGQRYLDETASYRGAAPYFIDKMPNNFQHVGLIAKAIPQAIFIDARRDPRACCWSAFTQNFARGQTFSYDLETLARYYRAYMGLMDHWDAVLPGRVPRVQYEDMVSNTEAQVRGLIAHCGLDFEAGCLAFHETKRAVRTASAEQVRRPIYASGVDHWRNFETWLGPLLGALGSAAATQQGARV